MRRSRTELDREIGRAAADAEMDPSDWPDEEERETIADLEAAEAERLIEEEQAEIAADLDRVATANDRVMHRGRRIVH